MISTRANLSGFVSSTSPSLFIETAFDDATKAKLDGLVATFKTNIEAKFSTGSECVAYIETVIKKASAIKNVGPKLRLSLKYIIIKLEDLKDSYSNDDDTIGGVLKVE